ncbi:hypothetical protein NG2371_03388 [Nocardia gamkensis]|nr:hypothetical protein [Nocardia gamkensis]
MAARIRVDRGGHSSGCGGGEPRGVARGAERSSTRMTECISHVRPAAGHWSYPAMPRRGRAVHCVQAGDPPALVAPARVGRAAVWQSIRRVRGSAPRGGGECLRHCVGLPLQPTRRRLRWLDAGRLTDQAGQRGRGSDAATHRRTFDSRQLRLHPARRGPCHDGAGRSNRAVGLGGTPLMISRRMRCPVVVHLHLHPHALGHETCRGKHLVIRTGIGFVNLVGERNKLCGSFPQSRPRVGYRSKFGPRNGS